MYRVLLFILLSHCFYAQMNPVMWQVQNDTIMKWGYFFGDEFNGDQINEDLWHPNYPWGGLSLDVGICLLYTSPSPRDLSTSRMPSSA